MTLQQNEPSLWQHNIPRKDSGAHKYDHGFAVIYGAPELTGATRLAASACARMGCGLVSVLASSDSASVYRTSLPAHIMVREDLSFTHEKVSAKLYGSGGLPCPVPPHSSCPVILDAEALQDMSFPLSYPAILTPHDGEFSKCFPDFGGTRAEKAAQAAQRSGSVIVLKGGQTLIAHPAGRVIENTHASPWLATAGTGDVLAGMITGLVARGMDLFDAACAAVWIHGECGLRRGAYMVASDIEQHIPAVMRDITRG